MKRFVYFATLMVTSLTFLTGCNEYDDNELLPAQTYQVSVETKGALSEADQISLSSAMMAHHVDPVSNLVTTDNLPQVVKSMRNELNEVSTAMMIGFKLQEETSDRYVATIVLGGYDKE